MHTHICTHIVWSCVRAPRLPSCTKQIWKCWSGPSPIMIFTVIVCGAHWGYCWREPKVTTTYSCTSYMPYCDRVCEYNYVLVSCLPYLYIEWGCRKWWMPFCKVTEDCKVHQGRSKWMDLTTSEMLATREHYGIQKPVWSAQCCKVIKSIPNTLQKITKWACLISLPPITRWDYQLLKIRHSAGQLPTS